MMDVKMPDGTIIKNVPDNYSQEDLLAQYNQMQQPSDAGSTTPSGAATGVFPQATGRRQLQDTERAKNIPLALLESAVAGGLSVPSALAQFAGLDKPNNVVNAIKHHAAEMSYPAVAEAGSTVGSALATALPVAKTMELAGKIPFVKSSELLKGGLGGLTAGALTPTKSTKDYGEFIGEKTSQLPEAALTGGVLSKLGQVAMNPQVSEDIQRLLDMGMTKFTPGQLLSDTKLFGMPIGAAIREGEKKLTSVPLLGDIIGGGLRTSFKDFNKAMANKALEPLGITVPSGVKEGAETNQFIQNAIDEAYQNVRDNSIFRTKVIDTHGRDVAQRLTDAMDNHAPNLKDDKKQFINDIKNNIIETMRSSNILGGDVFREMEEKLGELATRGYEKNSTLGTAYTKMLQALRDELARQNPNVARYLQNTHEVFKNKKVLEKAASRVGNEDAVYNPQQFKNAVKATAGTSNAAQGLGRFVDEANAASNVLGNTVPDSGTAGRSMMGQALLGLGSATPLAGPLAAKALVGSAAYSPLGMRLLTKMATERPQSFIRNQPKVSAGLASLGGNLGSGLASPQPDVDLPVDLGTVGGSANQ